MTSKRTPSPLRPGGTATAFGLAALLSASAARADAGLESYRHFRAAVIDLTGRIPTREEIASFERGEVTVDDFVSRHLEGPGYAARLSRIWIERLRLEVGSQFTFSPSATLLRRVQVLDPQGRTTWVYFRRGQRRARIETDGEFCLTQAETGQQFPIGAQPVGTARAVTQAAWDQATVVVRPWWLYRDATSAAPVQRWTEGGWDDATRLFRPSSGLLTEADGSPTTSIRVCREEAAVGETGTVFAPGRPAPVRGQPPPYGRTVALPQDSTFARANVGMSIACAGNLALQNSADCGCGPALSRCLPGETHIVDPRAFQFVLNDPLGTALPLDDVAQTAGAWSRFWWGEEAARFVTEILGSDRDIRDLLRARDGWVNGPTAQFYRAEQHATFPVALATYGYTRPVPLFDPSGIPADVSAVETDRWVHVADRGPQASGLLTLPAFLVKYGSRRARAHVLTQAFLCRDFVANNAALMPSTDPDLTRRPGCATCHATLEPMAAFYGRILESDWTFLPASNFPARNPACALPDSGRAPTGVCAAYYDPAFATGAGGVLRGVYGAPANADAGPAGLAAQLVNDPAFAGCVVETVASSFLGRSLRDDDEGLRIQLERVLVDGGYRIRPLVRALLAAPEYARVSWRSPASVRADGGTR